MTNQQIELRRSRDKARYAKRMSTITPEQLIREKEARKEKNRLYKLNHPDKIAVGKTKYQSRLKAQLDALKIASGCTDCGYKAYAEALDYDHLPGNPKINTIARLRGGAECVLQGELQKCELVCANCHRIRTAQRRLGENVSYNPSLDSLRTLSLKII